jgi:hypothetical protein
MYKDKKDAIPILQNKWIILLQEIKDFIKNFLH